MLSACERPLVEPRRPTIEILEPDFATVFADDSIKLIVRAEAFRSVESVMVDGESFHFDEAEQVWIQSISLRSGLNRVILSVTDADGQTAWDTAYAYRGALSAAFNAPALPDGRGGHTATLLQDGSILVLGGSSSHGAPARSDGTLLQPGTAQFRPMAEQMLAARAGHTATLLPDGRVLIVGGGRNSALTQINDLVETVEIYDPATRRFTDVPVKGAPVRRAFHTAVLRIQDEDESVLLDLFGGQGDIQYSPSPLLGTRNDVRSFVLRSDSLIARSPAPGPNLGFQFAGHTHTALDAEPARKMLLAGAQDAADPTTDFSSIIDYTTPGGLLPRLTGSMVVPRKQHAAEQLRPGRILLVGGRRGPPSTTVADPEIFVEEVERFFLFSPSSGGERRFALSATKLPNQRILFMGGFSPSGEGVASSEIYQATPP